MAALSHPALGRQVPDAVTLDQWPLHQSAEVLEVSAPSHAPEWRDWLEDIGFLPGENVRVLARARPGDDPLVVRVGSSTFALRRAEAACILIGPID